MVKNISMSANAPFSFNTNMAEGLSLLAIRAYGHSDCVGAYDGILLEFQNILISVVIDYDDCSISWIKGNLLPRDNEQIEIKIRDIDKYCGRLCFAWEMVNQAGIQDGLQLCVLHKGEDGVERYNTIQIMGGGIGLLVNYVIDSSSG